MAVPVPPRSGMVLSFDDEFNRSTLNVTNPDNTKTPGWMTTFPWGARIQGQFGQQQLFVDPDYVTKTGVKPNINPFSFSPNPTDSTDQVMTITADRTPAEYRDAIGTPYVSGHINSVDAFDFRYGYAEMRAQVAPGKGLMSTFYLLRTDKAPLGEIDINEYLGATPKSLYQTVHYTDDAGNIVKDKTVRAVVDNLSLAYHTYGVDWTPDTITFYLDGVRMGSVATPKSVNAPMYMIADLSVGGDFPGYPDSTTVFPANYKIDYIRVWQDQSVFTPKVVNGTAGNETLSGGDGPDTVSGLAGDDTLMGGGGNDSVHGDLGNDRLLGNIGADTLVGGAGTDTLEGGGGNDLIFMKPGDTVVERVNGGLDTIMTGGDNYTNTAGVEGIVYTGNVGFSSLGQPLNNVMIGGAAGDTLNGGAGADTIRGGAGNDSIIGGDGHDLIFGGAGYDTMSGNGGIDTFVFLAPGVATADLVTAFNTAEDKLDLRGLGLTTWAQIQPLITASGTSDTIIRYNNETITVQGVKATLWAEKNFVTGAAPVSAAPTAINLSEANVAAHAAIGTQVGVLYAIDPDPTEASTFTLTDNAGGRFSLAGRVLTVNSDIVDNTSHSYTVGVRALNDAGVSYTTNVVVHVGPDTGGGGTTEPSGGGNAIIGTAGNDIVSGTVTPAGQPLASANGDTITGGLGNDRLDGIGGNDSIDGGTGADTVIGGAGADTLIGGAGLDTASYVTSTTGLTIHLATPSLSTGDAVGDVLTGVEWIEGSNFADTIVLGGTAMRVSGLGGDDTITGGTGNDTIMGNDGNDRITGGAGNDSLMGQTGNDTFVFNAGSGKDIVAGFAAGTGVGDVVEFHGQFTSFAQVQAASTQETGVVGPTGASFTGTVIHMGTDEIWLAGVNKTALAANDFAFLA